MNVKVSTYLARNKVLAIGCVLVLVASGFLWWVMREPGNRITAYFDRAVGLYSNSSVRVLGVEVGTIDSVAPVGGRVRVDMTVDDTIRIPADARAVMVAPSLVSDRYVQLTPAYTAGPQLQSGAVLPKDRTAAPAELDDLYRSANALAQTLGPNGSNQRGELSDLLDTAAANLDGNGEKLNVTIERLGKLAGTLSDSRGDFFATVDNLNEFTATLAQSDGQIRNFYGKIADVTGFLADEREQTAASLGSLATALGDLEGFVRDNRESVASNVRNLTGVTQALVNQRKAIGEVIDIAPTGVSNFINAYDSASGTVAVRANINELTHPPVLMVCKLIEHGTPDLIPQSLRQACGKLAPVLDGTLKLPSVGETLHHVSQGELPPLPVPLSSVLPSDQGTSGGPR